MFSLYPHEFLKKPGAALFRRMKRSRFINDSDREIVEALERLFILEPPKTDDPEDEFDYVALRTGFSCFILVIIARLISYITGVDPFPPIVYSIVITGFFTWLGIMLHFETKQQSNIMLLLTWAAFCFSFW